MPLAVLDVGSNTIRLLVADVTDGAITPLLDKSAFVRLGRDVDRTGELQPDRMEAGVEAIRDLALVARTFGADRVTAIATSAVRDAANGPAFVRRVREDTGVETRIISGDDEAALTFRGATLGLNLEGGAMIVDLGGGSAECIFAQSSGTQWERSVKLGSGRLTERFLQGDPPQTTGLVALRAFVRETLGGLPPAEARQAIFTGGTATAVARLAGRTGDVVDFSLNTLDGVVKRVVSTPSAELVKDYGMQQERAHVLPAGATTLETIARFYRVDRVVVTQHGIREGVLLASHEMDLNR